MTLGGHVEPCGPKGRQETEEDRCRGRDGDREAENARIERHVQHGRSAAKLTEPNEEAAGPVGEQRARHRAAEGEQQTLCEELPDNAGPAGAECQPHGDFATADDASDDGED